MFINGRTTMRTLGNVLWHFPFFGFLTALLTFLCGLILMILVIPAPIGRGLVEHAKFPSGAL